MEITETDVEALGLLESAIELRLQAKRLRRQSAEQAGSLWRALVSGRWSLLESVDRDARHFILARRNPPELKAPRGLTPNERAAAMYAAQGLSNKLIAHELGLAPSTVSGLLTSAMRKLGLRSRAQLRAAVAGTAART